MITQAFEAAVPDGDASEWDVAFKTDIETLRTIDDPLNGNTALGAARAGDWTPLERDIPDGVEWTEEHASFVREFTFHFWNREWPEVVRFGEDAARRLHGADASLIYYEKGLRLGWFHVGPGMHVNADRRDQMNPFPTWFVITDGAMQARIDGRKLSLEAGQAVLVPERKAHEFWVRDNDNGASGLIVMFGEGA